MGAKFDPICVLEAGYRRHSDHDSWVHDVAETLRPALDRGLGAIAYTIPRGMFRPTRLTLLDAQAKKTGLARHLFRLLRAALTPGVLERYKSLKPLGLISTRDTLGDIVVHEAQLVDSLGLLIPDGEGSTSVFGFDSDRVESVSEFERRLWSRVALHLGASIRLLSHPGHLDDPEVEAILETDGTLVHSSSDEATKEQASLRHAVRQIDRARTRASRSQPSEALELWAGLLLGRWSLVDHFDTDGRHYVVARRNTPHIDALPCLSRRESQVAFYAAIGLSNKEIGYALGLSPSTVRTHLSNLLQKLGLDGRLELIAIGAQLSEATVTRAWRVQSTPRRPRRLELAGHDFAVASSTTEAVFPSCLTPSEREVAQLLVEGYGRAQIASIRQRSPRTVSNQITSIFRKVGVTSTVELASLARIGFSPAQTSRARGADR